MAVAERGRGSAASSGTSNQAVTVNVAPQAGDHIYVLVNCNNNSSGAHPTPAITGFSTLTTSTASVWSRLSLLGKIATGSEGTSFTATGFTGADFKSVGIVILSGAGASLATNFVTTPDASASTSWTIPAITTAAANSMDVACVGGGGNNNSTSPTATLSAWGSSLAEIIDQSADYAIVGVAMVLRASAGLQAATSVTSVVNDVNAAIRFEVPEAAAAATTSYPPVGARVPMAILAR